MNSVKRESWASELEFRDFFKNSLCVIFFFVSKYLFIIIILYFSITVLPVYVEGAFTGFRHLNGRISYQFKQHNSKPQL